MIHEIVHKLIGYAMARNRMIMGKIPSIHQGDEIISLDELWTRRATESITQEMSVDFSKSLTEP